MNGNGVQQPQQRTYDGNIQIPITLQLAVWGNILNQLAEGPWKTVDPLMKAINEQIAVVLQRVDQPAPALGEPALNRPE
jgi:hypothetical protein